MIRKERILLRFSEPKPSIKVIRVVGREHSSEKNSHDSRENCPFQCLLGLNLCYSPKSNPQNYSEYTIHLLDNHKVSTKFKDKHYITRTSNGQTSAKFCVPGQARPRHTLVSPLLFGLLTFFMEHREGQVVNHFATCVFADSLCLSRSSITCV